MVNKADTNKARLKRHKRVRGKISGTASRPRLCVYRSLDNIYAQVIDDAAGKTLVSASTVEKKIASELEKTNNVAAAEYLGKVIAERAKAAGID